MTSHSSDSGRRSPPFGRDSRASEDLTRLGVGELGRWPGDSYPERGALTPSNHRIDSFEELLGLHSFEDPEADPDPFEEEVPTHDVSQGVAQARRRKRRTTISSVDRLDARRGDSPNPPSPPGERLVGGRYRLEGELADGGMARILKVSHIDLGKTFALKIIHRNLSGDPAVRRMFDREARVASALDHPHIVQVTDFGVDPELGSYIVMEYLKGETLRGRIRRQGPLPVASVLDVGQQVASALHYMHTRDFIHGDVKTENVFLCRLPPDSRQRLLCRLIDFGLSRRVVAGARQATSDLGGTPEYVSPEQIRGEAPQPSMDIYSLGILLYEALAGRPPFAGNPGALLQAHQRDRPLAPSRYRKEALDEQLEAFVLRLLAKEAEDRPASMERVLYHLRTLADMLGVRRGRFEPVEPAAEAPGRAAAAVVAPAAAATLAPDQRSALDALQGLVQSCPCPLFRVDGRGILRVVNRAFCEFVRLPPSEAVGTSIGLTRLCYIYPEIDVDVIHAAREHSPEPILRIVSFPGGRKGTTTVKILLVPEPTATGRVEFFSGIIHPVRS